MRWNERSMHLPSGGSTGRWRMRMMKRGTPSLVLSPACGSL